MQSVKGEDEKEEAEEEDSHWAQALPAVRGPQWHLWDPKGKGESGRDSMTVYSAAEMIRLDTSF